MDIVLEVIDTFVFDYVYAAILPARPAPYDFLSGASNATYGGAAASTWRYQPASKYIGFEPREAAYLSSWQRDNLYRQFISLFLITWYVHNSYERTTSYIFSGVLASSCTL